ncbi:MAG: hypothetical protein KAQ65_10895 [Candidatus Thorarchaeota archaeon]|nr:hypothetical protein [Candidatus Thorarchaeota archaeon]MCK5238791.1 hypothetical protein [Candidatus Thorarchaeota archaeon]
MFRLAGYGVTDPVALTALWNLYSLWVFVSIILVFIPVIVGFFVYRPNFKKIILFEAGGLGLFTPFWFALATEISGESFIGVILNGVENGLPFFNESGQIVGISMSPILLVPILLLMIVIGLILLRPSYLLEQTTPKKLPELAALTEPDPIETEMPDVAPPVADASSIDELRTLLVELSVPLVTIDIIVNAGYATITDLVGTSPEQLASTTGLDPKIVQDIHLTVQKKVWFGDI